MVNFPYRYVPGTGFRRGYRSPWSLARLVIAPRRAAQCPDPEGALHCTKKKGGWNLNSDIGDIYYVHICICIYIYIYIYRHMKGISHIILYTIYIYRHIPNKMAQIHPHCSPVFHAFGLVPQPLANHPMAPDPRWYLVVHQSIAGGKHPILKQVTLP